MIEIKKYTADKKNEWDDFVTQSKNGTFLFYRDYMEYHSDRFEDFSLTIYYKNKLVALFPANIVGDTVYSHQGLTFGGIIHPATNTSLDFLTIFDAINLFYRTKKIYKIQYKAIPQIYKSHLGDEEYYALYRKNAQLISCNLSSCICFTNGINISKDRKNNYKKAVKNRLTVISSTNFEAFWQIMEDNMMERFQNKPVHSFQEMEYLHKHFENNIELWIAKQDDNILGGAVIYKFKNVIKVQYAHSNREGKQVGAIDIIYFHLINTYKDKYEFIDFGHSNTNNGLEINAGLYYQKESLGARGVVFNTYEFEI